MENTSNKSNDELTRKDAHELLTEMFVSMSGSFMFFAGGLLGIAWHFFTQDNTTGMIVFFIGFLVCLIAGYSFRKKLKARVMEMIKEIK